MTSLGGFLRIIRKRLGLTQEVVAEKLNIMTPVLSKWENDKSVPDLAALCKLCNAYKISISDCITLEISENPILPPEEYNAIALGETIKELRQRNGWTQGEVGNKLFVTSQTVSKWECGGVSSLEQLQKLSTLFAVSPDVLLGGINSSATPLSSPAEISNTYITPPSSPTETAITKSTNKKMTITVIALLLSLVLVIGAIICAILIKNRNPAEDNADGNGDDNGDGYEVGFVLPIADYEACANCHNGETPCLDFTAQLGTCVYSVASGTVILVDYYNHAVTIDHGNDMITIYNSIDTEQLFAGDKVEGGQFIGTVSGVFGVEQSENGIGSHLCLQIQIDGAFVDPALYLPING